MRALARNYPLTLVAAIVLAAAALVLVWRSDAGSRQFHHARYSLPRTEATVTIGSVASRRTVPPGFLGFSFEFWALEGYAGSDPHRLDRAVVQLIRNLTGGHRTVIRIGGISTDRTWWPVAGVKRSPGAPYTLTPARLEVARALARATDARLILGVQFEANSSAEAAAESKAMVSLVGRHLIEGFELGNEPELYGIRWFYKVHGVDVFARPPSWDFPSYLRDYTRIASPLGNVPLVGPATGVYPWMADLPRFISVARPSLATVHRYPLQSCGPRPGAFNYPTVAHLLGRRASTVMADELQPYIALVHARHVQVRNAEMNSVSCGNAPGVANTFASALWALDTLFNMARIGVDGVNIHTYSGAADALFSTTEVGSRWHAHVAPEYYGVWLFSQAAPPGSRLLQVSASGRTRTLRAWATTAPDGRIHVVLINDSTTHAESVAVRLAGGSARATLERLEAPDAHATAGVTLGGWSFGSDTPTGVPRGRLRVTKLAFTAGAYVVRVPAASAAMITRAANRG